MGKLFFIKIKLKISKFVEQPSTNFLFIPQIYSGMDSKSVIMDPIEPGCVREDQCSPNPCKNGGHCTDRWRDFSCKCERPYLGHTCQYNMIAATFGHENIKNSYVTVKVSDRARRLVRSVIDISMFIRTRETDGDIFYLGSELNPQLNPKRPEETCVAVQLKNGLLQVRIQIDDNETYTVGGTKLNDSNNHLIQVIRNNSLVQVKINGSENFRKTISATGPLNATVLYLGGLPQASRVKRQADSHNTLNEPQVNFKGVIQDVQISNGNKTMVVEIYPLKAKDIPTPTAFGNVTFDKNKVLEGVVSDNVCNSSPCFHNGTCHVTWNDFWCQCPRGYTGKTCQDMEFCQLQDCPTGSKCQNLDDGYECIANATFDGLTTSFTYVYDQTDAKNVTDSKIDTIEIAYRSKSGGTLMHMATRDGYQHFTISVYKDNVTVSWKLDTINQGSVGFGKEESGGNWTSIVVKMGDNWVSCCYDDTNDDSTSHMSENFSLSLWHGLLETGTVTLGGLADVSWDRNIYDTDETEKQATVHREGVYGNSVDFIERGLTTAMPSHGMISGEPFKGCLGEVRIGNMLLHYFTYEEVHRNANFTPVEFLKLMPNNRTNEDVIGCRLCFENDCKNLGHCLDELNSYVCECPAGYAEDDCSVNIDECADNKCKNGAACVDGIANYTCECNKGWEGWL